jgi:hypothetical protein
VSDVSTGTVAVGDTGRAHFEISNPSRFDATWAVSCVAPFTLSPSSGFISPHGKAQVQVRFDPTEARQHRSFATVKYDAGDGGTGTVEVALLGVAQYPHLRCNLPDGGDTVEFPNAVAGGRVVREVSLSNVSPVSATYTVLRAPGPTAPPELSLGGHHFEVLSGGSGVVAPGAKASVKVNTPSPNTHTPERCSV